MTTPDTPAARDSRACGVLVLVRMLATIAWCTVVDVARRVGGRR